MSAETALKTYLQHIQDEYKHAEAREHAYRPALKGLLESLGGGGSASGGGFHAVNDAARIKDVGAPDFIIKRGQFQVAFAEAKDINVDLNKVERTEQFQNYLKALPNLLLTDYLEFRWYLKGEHQATARLATAARGKLKTDTDGLQAVSALLDKFALQEIPTVATAEELAAYMAGMARNIAGLIEKSYADSETLKGEKQAFEETLIPNLSVREFADMYAQTLAYGLFAARVEYSTGKPEGFTLETAFFKLPKTNPFLTRFFQTIVPEMDERVRWQVDTLTALLAHADTDTILEGFGKKTRQEDPIVHFYETFLRDYDPRLRESRGVYYTPEPVVSYIVRSVDHLLKTKFGRTDGLADKETYILDPATGTGTFLYFVIQQIYEQLGAMRGMWDGYVRDHLLKRIFGFELLMAPYAVAHMKLGILLKEQGYTFKDNQRLGVFLTNALEEQTKQTPLPLAQFISEEANKATEVKREKPIMVVLGNPPYSNFGQMNQGKWILEQLEDYKKDLDERKLNLDDDYIKFIKFGQWRIQQTGQGILAFVTNNSFLEGITHRRMRQSLRETFSEIYVINLHGNSRKQETTPDGNKDENVFDIQQGVSITIFVKSPSNHTHGNVYYYDLWGLREEKYSWLNTSSLSTTEWKQLHNIDRESCLGKFYFFTPKASDNPDEYCQGVSVETIFPIHQNGLKTDRDDLFFDFERQELEKRMTIFYSDKGLTSDFRNEFNVNNSSSYDLLSRRQRTNFTSQNIRPCLYRPFDTRWLYYDHNLTSRPAWGVMRHMTADANLALITLRQTRRDETGTFLVAQGLINKDAVSLFDIGTIFPLYEFLDLKENTMFAQVEGEWAWSAKGRRPNLSQKFVREMESRLGLKFAYDNITPEGEDKTFTPEDIFAYAYAVFHSPTYRSRYAEFLKIDFPRLPLTSDTALFWTLVGYGNELINAHLLRGDKVNNMGATFPMGGEGKGDGTVAARHPKWDEATQRVNINQTQYFEGIERDVWEFHIGGYQVCEKWLKDRVGRALTFDDVRHYGQIITAIRETIRLMDAIDDAIPTFPLA